MDKSWQPAILGFGTTIIYNLDVEHSSYHIARVFAGEKQMTELRWSEWFSLVALEPKDVPPLPGVYQMRWGGAGAPKPIPRTNRVDSSGCLYVGSATDLQRRIRVLRRGILQGDRTRNVADIHTAAYTYTVFGYCAKFPSEELEVRWAETAKSRIRDHEANLLADYVRSYFDKPPLNSVVKRLKVSA